MTQGILLSAFGRRGYMYAAFNMLVSIKHFNPNIKVALAYDAEWITHLLPERIAMFDELIEIPKEQFFSHRIDPAKYKTAIYKYLPYDETLILDVDGCCFKDLQPFLDHLSGLDGNIYTDTYEYGKADVWASFDYMKEVFGCDVTIPIQSSWMFIRKPFAEFFDELGKNLRKIDKSKITLWGGTIPDELIYQGTFAQFGINPRVEVRPIFFGNVYAQESYEELAEKYYILSLYGNGTGRSETKLRYIEHYDRIMRTYCNSMGLQHDYKVNYIMQDKHLNWK